MIIYENFLNDLTDYINNNMQFVNGKILNSSKYSNDDNGIYFMKRIKKDHSKKIYLREAATTEKLWFFYNIFGGKRPKSSKQIKELDETDFKFFSELRNFLLHENGKIKNSNYLVIYNKIEFCIVTQENEILLNSTFFSISVHNLFKNCLQINNVVMKKIIRNLSNKSL